jgi:hypothetical protein
MGHHLLVVLCLWLPAMVLAAEPEETIALKLSNLTASQIEGVEKLRQEFSVDFLVHPKVGEDIVLLLPASEKSAVQKRVLALIGSEADDITGVILQDVKKERIENEKRRKMFQRFRAGTAAPLNYFPKLPEIYTWLNSLPAKYKNVSLENIGFTYENRSMLVLKINAGRNLPKVFIESAIHAREWLSPTTSIYMIDKILQGAYGDLLSRFELHFLVIANPDGYVFTHTSPNNIGVRLWRKNRRQTQPSRQCFGADLNRNFDIDFGKQGASGYCGSDIFPGPHPFSEPESVNERNYLLKNAQNMVLYLSLHSFGQMVLVPHCYTDVPPQDDARLRSIGQAAVEAFAKVGKTPYRLGTANQLGLGLVSGSSIDWVKDIMKVPNTFAIELQPDDDGFEGFLPPSTLIAPSGEETLAALVAMLQKI